MSTPHSPEAMTARSAQWSQAEVHAFALTLPETHEGSHMGRSDLRVRDKIFATLPEDRRTVNLKTTPLALDMLIRSDPRIYRDVWGGRWVGVTVDLADPRELRDLLLEAYCLAAPRSLAARVRAELDAS